MGSLYVIRLGVPAPILPMLEAIPIRSLLLDVTNDEETPCQCPRASTRLAYLRTWASELGERIVKTYPPLHGFDDGAYRRSSGNCSASFPGTDARDHGVAKRWNEARGAAVIAECGTGKTLISLGAVHVHSERKPLHSARHGSTAVG